MENEKELDEKGCGGGKGGGKKPRKKLDFPSRLILDEKEMEDDEDDGMMESSSIPSTEDEGV